MTPTPQQPCPIPGQQVLEGTQAACHLQEPHGWLSSLLSPQPPGPMGTLGGTGGGTWGCPPTVRLPC